MKLVEITSIKKIPYKGKVYDLEVEEDHSYNINGILVHNSDFVMIGGMLAFHNESEEEVVDGKIRFYGMSSDAAMDRHGARKDGYRSCEGKVVELPCRGQVSDTILEILGGLRSTCSYVGARRLKDLSKCTTFVRVYQTHNTVYGDEWQKNR